MKERKKKGNKKTGISRTIDCIDPVLELFNVEDRRGVSVVITGINLNDVRALPGQGGGKNTLDDAGAGDENVAFLREVVTVGLVYAGKGRDDGAPALCGGGRIRGH